MNKNLALGASGIMKKYITSFVLAMGACVSLGLLSGCASSSSQGSEIQDPFEGYNRGVFAFNNAVDDAFIHPTVDAYREVVPSPARKGISNFLTNLKSPVNLGNQLLQGDFDGAADVVLRAIINTTVGIGGLIDIAGHEGIEHESEDFGQTLAVWGVDHGPFLVVPFMGAASLRDGTGFFVDAFADPLRWYTHNIDKEGLYYAKAGADYLNLRESLVDVLRDLESSSIDYYAAVRSTYYQRRKALVEDLDKQTDVSPSYQGEEGYGWDDF